MTCVPEDSFPHLNLIYSPLWPSLICILSHSPCEWNLKHRSDSHGCRCCWAVLPGDTGHCRTPLTPLPSPGDELRGNLRAVPFPAFLVQPLHAFVASGLPHAPGSACARHAPSAPLADCPQAGEAEGRGRGGGPCLPL